MNKFFLIFLTSVFVLPTIFATSARAIDEKTSNTPLVVVSKDKPVDMLSATPLANKLNSDILFFDEKPYLHECIGKERLEQSEKIKNASSIILIGGEDSLNSKYFNDNQVTRLSGKNRYDTSLETLKYHEKLKNTKKIHLVSGRSFADASIVASKDTPVVLVNNIDDNENIKIKSELDRLSTYNVIVGGESVVSDYLQDFFRADRISGKDRYDTSKIFSGNNVNGYIESDDISFVNNIKDAHKAFEENKGFHLKRYVIKEGDIVFGEIKYDSKLNSGNRLLEKTNTSKKLYNHLNEFIEGVNSGKYKRTYEIYSCTLNFKVSFDKYAMSFNYPLQKIDNSLYFSLSESGTSKGIFKIPLNDKLIENIFNELKYIIVNEL
ncbi:cell wall-binding repeat-containing protein [Peptostreptococcus faecalis]|uniref:cell wall-binding repeat-containing protein n=1 Tax=Peptostreptococcus faecalis TaxID=2045015 RepID=UPI000C7E3370|nr:cell wall-binding repeat-containing protein [Peptostreptococcus faecalis]